MDGQPYKAGHHAATLRRLLWREHLGLLPAQKLDASGDPNAQPPDVCPNDVIEGPEYEFVADPLSDKVWDMWTGNATKNTDLFRHLFRADPDDNSKCLLSFPPSFHLARSIQIILTLSRQSKPSPTTAPSSPNTKNSSKAISTILSCLRRRSGRSSTRFKAIWSGCRWTS